jgi:A/G-specific adenine glycosylase
MASINLIPARLATYYRQWNFLHYFFAYFVYFAVRHILNTKFKTQPPSLPPPPSFGETSRYGAAQAKLVAALLDWFAANARDLPWRRTRDPYAIWVSEIMLQQTQVKTVIPFWNRWMQELPTIEAAANASSDKLHKLWEGLGYYTRVRNLQKAAQIILNRHDGKFPERFEDVLALPGIGRYTAGAICSIAFNQPTPILDGNVIRLLARLFGIAENPKEKETNAKLWRIAADLVSHAKTQSPPRKVSSPHALAPLREENSRTRTKDDENCSHLNQSLMELGALVCTPRNAQCRICPVKKLCVAVKEKRVDELPNLGKRETATTRHFIAFAVESNGRFLVQQRPAGVVNAHLWEFPNVEVGARLSEPQQRPNFKLPPDLPAVMLAKLLRVTDPRSIKLKPLITVKHSITRYRITLEAFSVSLAKRPAKANGRWLAPAELDSIAFASAHKKLASAAAKSILTGR